MRKVLAIADIEPRDRLAYWYDVASTALVKHECLIGTPATFDATIYGAELGPVGIVSVASRGMRGSEVNERTIASTGANVLLLSVGIEGVTRIRQDGREATLRPGDITLLDARRPYSARYSESWKRLFFKIPFQALNSRLPVSPELTARILPSGHALGHLTSGYIQMLLHMTDAMTCAAKEQLAEQLLDLVALTLAAQTDNKARAIAGVDAIALLHVRVVIDSRLTDPALNAETVAAAAGLNVRGANRLLKEEGTTIDRLIVSRRLDRCRRALEDRTQSRRTVSEIAYAWGFADVSHFARRFKAAYGCSPGEYRRHLSD